MKQEELKKGEAKIKNRFPKFQERLAKIQGDRDQTEFADFLGVSRQTIGFYLRGERIPDIQVLADIANKCNVSADYLIGLSDVETRDPTIKQVCNYLGLSEKAAAQLHKYYEKEDCSASLEFVDSFLRNSDIEMFEMYATCSVLARISSEMFERNNPDETSATELDGETTFLSDLRREMTKTQNTDSERLWDEVLGRRSPNGRLEISSNIAADLYENHAKEYIAEILARTMFEVYMDIAKKHHIWDK